MKSPFSKFSGVGKGLAYGSRIMPERDWLRLVSVAILLFIASLGFNFWYFTYLTSGGAIGVTSTAPAVAPPSVDGVQKIFQNRAAEQARYQSGYTFVDPSVPGS
jgi:hypothetical protein